MKEKITDLSSCRYRTALLKLKTLKSLSTHLKHSMLLCKLFTRKYIAPQRDLYFIC